MANEKKSSAGQVPGGVTGGRPGSNRTAPATAGKASGSGVRQAPRQMETPPPPPQRTVARRAGQGAPVAKKKPSLPMKEILIATGGLLAILAIALIVGYLRTKERTKIEDVVDLQNKIMERNVQTAKDEMKKAVDAGTLFTVGKETIDAKDPSNKLLAPFKGNSKIYNVIYNRDYKDKKLTEKHDQVALVDDLDHRTINELNKAIPEEKDMTVKYALARDKDKIVPVVMATKIIHPGKEDLVNTGGKIMVVVLAEEDDFFHRALQKELPKAPSAPETKPSAPESKAVSPEAKPAAADTKPLEKKTPASTEKTAPAEKKPAAPVEDSTPAK